MVRFENECVGCPPEIGCFGDGCPYRRVLHLICDKCKFDVDTLYHWKGEEWCIECITDDLEKVEVHND